MFRDHSLCPKSGLHWSCANLLRVSVRVFSSFLEQRVNLDVVSFKIAAIHLDTLLPEHDKLMHGVIEDRLLHGHEHFAGFSLELLDIAESASMQLGFHLGENTEVTRCTVRAVWRVGKGVDTPFLKSSLGLCSCMWRCIVMMQDKLSPFPKIRSFSTDGLFQILQCLHIRGCINGGSWCQKLNVNWSTTVTKKCQHCFPAKSVRSDHFWVGFSFAQPH